MSKEHSFEGNVDQLNIERSAEGQHQRTSAYISVANSTVICGSSLLVLHVHRGEGRKKRGRNAKGAMHTLHGREMKYVCARDNRGTENLPGRFLPEGGKEVQAQNEIKSRKERTRSSPHYSRLVYLK